jgi:phage/plasmid-associated DNA primase
MSNTNNRFEIVEESEEEVESEAPEEQVKSPRGMQSKVIPKSSFELVEEVDMKALRIIRDNFEEVFKRVNNFKHYDYNQSCFVSADFKTAQTVINKLYSSKVKSNTVKYRFSSRLDYGRRYSINSLQGITRQIRHTISKDIYYDVDMKNAHPTFCLQLCKELGFQHRILNRYVQNRDKYIQKWIGVEVNEKGKKRTLDSKDSVKEYFLKMLNSGGNNNSSDPELNEFFDTHQKLLNIIYSKDEYKKYRERAIKSYNKKKKEDPKTWDNKKGSCLNYYLQDIENQALSWIENYLTEHGIEYGSLVFDGIMIYQKYVDEKELLNCMTEIEEYLEVNMGFRILLSCKPMLEAIDISDLKEKEEIKNTDEAYGKYLLKTLEGEILYSQKTGKMWAWNESEALWMKRDFSYIRTVMSRLKDYILTSPDPEFIKEELDLIESDRKQSSILKVIIPYIKLRTDEEFIKDNFNKQGGLFPIANKKVVDLRTGQVVDRVKTHYFTKKTDNKIVEISEEDRAYIISYYESLLTSKQTISKMGTKPSKEHTDSLINSFAYALTGENNLKAFINLIGKKDGGKSLCIELHHKIFEDLSGMANDRVFVQQNNKAVHDTEIYSLEGRRMICLSETDSKDSFREDLIKRITGRDKVEIRRAGGSDTDEFKFNCILFLATNNMCNFKDEAFKGRLVCFDFCNQFEKNETVPEKIFSLKDEFFTVLCEYAKKYYDNNRKIVWSNDTVKYTQQVCNNKNPLIKWLENDCEVQFYSEALSLRSEDADDFQSEAKETEFYLEKSPKLYEQYVKFCKLEQMKYDTRLEFYQALQEHFKLEESKPMKRGNKTIRGWKGLRIKFLNEDENHSTNVNPML